MDMYGSSDEKGKKESDEIQVNYNLLQQGPREKISHRRRMSASNHRQLYWTQVDIQTWLHKIQLQQYSKWIPSTMTGRTIEKN